MVADVDGCLGARGWELGGALFPEVPGASVRAALREDLAGQRALTPSGLAPPSAGPWLSPAQFQLEDAQLRAVNRVLCPATPFTPKASVPGVLYLSQWPLSPCVRSQEPGRDASGDSTAAPTYPGGATALEGQLQATRTHGGTLPGAALEGQRPGAPRRRKLGRGHLRAMR